jgi:nucleoside-triphosphatase THEP1
MVLIAQPFENRLARDVDLIVIDEIRKMECASERFRGAVEDALDAPVNILATIGISPAVSPSP